MLKIINLRIEIKVQSCGCQYGTITWCLSVRIKRSVRYTVLQHYIIIYDYGYNYEPCQPIKSLWSKDDIVGEFFKRQTSIACR